MPKKCNQCGELAVDEDDHVCRSCGIVVEDIEFREEFHQPTRPCVQHKRFKYPCYSGLRSRKNLKFCPIALTYGLNSLQHLCHLYTVTADRLNEASHILKSAYKERHFRQREDVGVLAGCCLFLLQRKYKQAVPVAEICHHLQCTRRKFCQYLKFLKLWLSSNKQKVTIDTEADTCVEKDLPEIAEPLIKLVCEKACKEDKSKLIKKTIELVKLANSCWLFTGRSPRSVVIACAFLCWKSMYPQRKRARYSQFCSQFALHDNIAKLRIIELKGVLLKLGHKIPSYSENYVNEDNLLFHLDTILENSETLRNDLLSDEISAEDINCKEYSTFRVPTYRPPRNVDKSAVEYDSDMNASDIEISDAEIQSYIRNDEEIKTAINLHDTKASKSPLT